MIWYKLEKNPSDILFGHIAYEKTRHPDRILDHWVFGYIYSGTLNIQIGRDKYSLKSGDYYLLPPGIRHFGLQEEAHDISFAHFRIRGRRIPVLKKIDHSAIILKVAGKTPSDYPIVQFMGAAEKLFMTGLTPPCYLVSHLSSLLFYLGIFVQKDTLEFKPDVKLAYEIYDFLQKNLKRNLSARDFEKEFNSEYYRLNKTFKKLFKNTIKQHFLELRISKAYEFLSHGEKISIVAEKLGFTDYFYFLKTFKKIRKITPKQLKKYYVD